VFAQLFADFDERVAEVDLYFKLLLACDNAEIDIKAGTGPQIVPPGAPPADWGRMLKGGAYLVLYNLVEGFVRRGFQAVFEGIKGAGLSGADLTDEFRQQWIKQRNRSVSHFDGSPGVYMRIAGEIIADVIGKKPVYLVREYLPLSGNLDADSIREVCRAHGVSGETPRDAMGGSALTIVKVKRNSLAHGDESFCEVGGTVSAQELEKAKTEIVSFLRGILNNLERFQQAQGYKYKS
jgi:MAE_28990/MAE_18760-like HEPN